jgi:hypothetical protein
MFSFGYNVLVKKPVVFHLSVLSVSFLCFAVILLTPVAVLLAPFYFTFIAGFINFAVKFSYKTIKNADAPSFKDYKRRVDNVFLYTLLSAMILPISAYFLVIAAKNNENLYYFYATSYQHNLWVFNFLEESTLWKTFRVYLPSPKILSAHQESISYKLLLLLVCAGTMIVTLIPSSLNIYRSWNDRLRDQDSKIIAIRLILLLWLAFWTKMEIFTSGRQIYKHYWGNMKPVRQSFEIELTYFSALVLIAALVFLGVLPIIIASINTLVLKRNNNNLS